MEPTTNKEPTMTATKLNTFPLLTSYARTARLEESRGCGWTLAIDWQGDGFSLSGIEVPDSEEAKVAYVLREVARNRATIQQLLRGNLPELPAARYTATATELVVIFDQP